MGYKTRSKNTQPSDNPASRETAYDRFNRRLKEHPLGITMLVAAAVVSFLGWDNVIAVYGWFLPDPECRYFVIEPFVRLENGSNPDEFPFFDVGEYDFGMSVGQNQTQAIPDRPKGFYASHLWRTTARLTKASHYLVTISPHFVDPSARGGPTGDITVRPMGYWEQRRYGNYDYLEFPECSALKSDVN